MAAAPSLHRKRSTPLCTSWPSSPMEDEYFGKTRPPCGRTYHTSTTAWISPLLLPGYIPIPKVTLTFIQLLTQDAAFLPTDFPSLQNPIACLLFQIQHHHDSEREPSHLKSTLTLSHLPAPQSPVSPMEICKATATPRLQPPGQRRATAGNNVIQCPRGRLDPSPGHPHVDRFFPGMLYILYIFSSLSPPILSA